VVPGLAGMGMTLAGFIVARLATPVMIGEDGRAFSIMDAVVVMFWRFLRFPQPLLIVAGGILLAVTGGLELEYHRRLGRDAWMKDYRPPPPPKKG
jgi:hypothetical protein